MSELSLGTLSGLAANSYVIDVAAGSQLTQPGMILQVVSTTKTDEFSTTSTSYVDVTGVSASITPRSTSSKILVSLTVGAIDTASTSLNLLGRVLRDSTAIGVGSSGDAAGFALSTAAGNRPQTAVWSFADSPASTSTLTYKFQTRLLTSGTMYVNRPASDSSRAVTTITLMEVAG